jgi:AcrR family transcriptional regulator
MSPSTRPVKRTYNASGRQEKARESFTATLDIAERMFLANGFEATTVAALAGAAGVSEATIYKTYGGKAGLAREVCHRALRGEGAIPAQTRSNALRDSASARDVAEGWGRLASEVAPRIAPLMLVLRDAGVADAEAAALYDEFDAERLERMTDNARFLQRAGFLRDGITLSEARDVLWFTTASEVYELLVMRRGWSHARFGRFVTDTIGTITR